MAYSVPKRWAHGDTVAAAEMQKYSDGLDYLYTLFPTEEISWGIGFSGMEDTQVFYIVHRQRWLIYVSTGEIQHPTDPDTYPAVSLSDTGGICVADVDQQVSWLVPGALYKVVGCSLAYEDADGIIA